MAVRFEHKTVWITGASSGIGEALALAMVDAGATVIASSSSEEKLNRVYEKCSDKERFFVVPLDLGVPESLRRAAEDVLDRFERIDILVNNGGISQRSRALDTPLDNDRKLMEIDYFGTVALTKAVLPRMIEQGGGHILCTSSIVGVFGFPLRSAYSAAKHALHGFFESLRVEYSSHGIKVGIIIGGRINTPISYSALTSDGTPYGKMDEGQRNGISPEKAARKIMKGIRRGRKEIWVGGAELIMIVLKRYLPGMHSMISGKVKPT